MRAGGKRCHSVPEVFRHTNAHFDDLGMEIAWGLHNCRAMLRYASLGEAPSYCQELCMEGSRGVFFYPESILEGHTLHDLWQVMGGP